MRALLLAIALAGCTYDYEALQRGMGDAGPPPPDAGRFCMAASECDDGIWCNGAERCQRNDVEADAFGCAPGIARCALTSECIEADQRCASGCEDIDGDGFEPQMCGGDDCDDADARRNPGGTERCDAEGLDEDCNPGTFGVLDADADSYADATCCNGDFCGDDCDDNRMDVHPDLPEVCDGIDTDCDGMIDEGVLTTFYRDGDGDGHGASAPTVLACSRPGGYANTPGDCDDGVGTTYPGAPELCNGRDDNCNGSTDDACM